MFATTPEAADALFGATIGPPTDFQLSKTGTADGAISSVTPGSGTTFTVTVSSLTGDGTLRLDVHGGTDIQDAAGNVAVPYSDGQAVTLDHTAPTASLAAVVPDPRNIAAGVVTVIFSEPVAEVNSEDIILTRNGIAVSLTELAVTMVSDSQYTLDLSTVSAAPGAYVLTLVAGGSNIQDTAGNPLAGDASVAFVVHPWQNVGNVYDVDGDTDVAPINVLYIINEINSKGTGPISLPTGKPPFVDVNGDDSLSAVDVLLVINVINQRVSGASGGEGDVASAGVGADSSPLAQPSLDQAIRADHNLPLDALNDYSSPTQARRFQEGISAFAASVKRPYMSAVNSTDGPPASAALDGRNERRRLWASTGGPRLESDAILGKPDSVTRVDELDDLLDLLANDVASIRSVSGLPFVR